MKTFKQFVKEAYKVGDKITYRNIKSKRNKTRAVRSVTKDKHGQTVYTVDGGRNVYHSDLDPKHQVAEKTLTPAEKKKREEIAKAIERDNPSMPMDKKMAIATAQAKKVAEETIPRDVMNRAKNISKISPFPVHVVKLPTGKFTIIQTSGLKRNNKGTIVAAFQYGIATNLPTAQAKKVAEERKGLWANIHAKRKRGEKPAKPGEKGYPKTLNVGEDLKQARKNVGADKCWDGYKAKGTKNKGGKEVPNCVKESEGRLQSAGVKGYNKPKRTPGHPKKSHIVVAKDGSKVKTIRFGEQGAETAGDPKKGESQRMKMKRKSFKARHRRNIAKGKMSAAYWADKVKW